MRLLAIAASALAISFFVYMFLIPAAVASGLVDKPNVRKNHNGDIPLVGGIGIYTSLMLVGAWVLPLNSVTLAIALSSTLMVLVGVWDDKKDLSVRLRIVIQLIAAAVLVFGGGIQIETLGDLLGLGEIRLGWFAAPFTILAIMTAMNAFNMIDGIDGLLGGLSLVTFFGIAALALMHGQPVPLLISLILMAALAAFLAHNVCSVKFKLRKIFMGDAGSMFIGLVVVCLLAVMTVPHQLTSINQTLGFKPIEGRGEAVRPVAVLWLIAVPLMDMFGIMARRVSKKQSPFKPDRDHLHHIFMRAGFTPMETMSVISLAGLGLVLLGLILEFLHVPEIIVTLLYIGVFALYVLCLRYTWRIVSAVRTWRGIDVAS